MVFHATQPVEDRFLSKVKQVDSGCHEWTSTLNPLGYGKFYYKKCQTPAHRAAHDLFVGEIPKGRWVLHKCDNRKCVNPAHLYLGDALQNAKDRTERRRWGVRFSKDIVDDIRRRYALGGITQQALADQYGMSQNQVSTYVLNKQRIFK